MSETQATAGSNSTSNVVIDPRKEAMVQIFGEEYADRFNDPVLFFDASFCAPTPLNFYRRDFKFLSRHMYAESVYRRRPDFEKDVLDRYSAMLSKKLADIETLLRNQNERIRVALRSNGVEENAVYLQTRTVTVPVIASHAKQYISLLKLMDEAYQLAGTALLHGIFDGAQRADAELKTRKPIRAFAELVRNEQIKLYKEARRVMDARNGKVRDEEMEAATAIAAKADAEYVAETDAADAIDGAAAVAAGEAAAVLDGILASGAAANAGRKRATKPATDTPATEPPPASATSTEAAVVS